MRKYFQDKKFLIKELREQWEKKYRQWSEKFTGEREQLERAINLEISEKMDFWNLVASENIATRNTSGDILDSLADEIPYLIGGSADLSPSTMTYLPKHSEIQKGCYDGRNIRFG